MTYDPNKATIAEKRAFFEGLVKAKKDSKKAFSGKDAEGAVQPCEVKPPEGWIKFAFEDEESKAVGGAKLKLKHRATERPPDTCKDDGTLEIKSLRPGDMDLLSGEAEGVWEFVELTSA